MFLFISSLKCINQPTNQPTNRSKANNPRPETIRKQHLSHCRLLSVQLCDASFESSELCNSMSQASKAVNGAVNS